MINKNNSKQKKVAVIGLGYVGLPTMVSIAKSKKYKTVGFDIDKSKIKQIINRIDPIHDPEVAGYLASNILDVSYDVSILKNSDFFLVAVPTPVDNEYMPNYEPVKSSMRLVAKYLKKNSHIILESTVNPGTSEEIILPILEEISGLKAGKDFNLAHCPERINPGDPKWNINNIPRNIGSLTKLKNKEVADFYRSFLPNVLINEVDNLKIAEATKIVENTFRDINIAYVNELAKSFDLMKIDLYETMKAASNKPFGFMAHWPGCGVGGHCIAVDPYYLINRASKAGFNHRFLKIAREINNSMPNYLVDKVIHSLNEIGLPVKGTKLLLLGLSYKPDVGDIRESPALVVKRELELLKADLSIYDPYIETYNKNLKSLVKESEVVIIATAHSEFIENILNLLKDTTVKIVIDGRNCLDKTKIEKLNIKYIGMGR